MANALFDWKQNVIWCDLLQQRLLRSLIIITLQQLNGTGMEIISETRSSWDPNNTKFA